jgi:hypothetical protein
LRADERRNLLEGLPGKTGNAYADAARALSRKYGSKIGEHLDELAGIDPSAPSVYDEAEWESYRTSPVKLKDE